MKYLFQWPLSKWDKFISWIFCLSSDRFSSGGKVEERYYGDIFPSLRIAIVDFRGELRTVCGYFTVNHYYDNKGHLIKRIPARKDLRFGEKVVFDQNEVSRLQTAYGETLPF